MFLKDDVISDNATQTVEVSPMFDDTESPESSHDVMSGAWDFEKLPLDKVPNWKQYATAAANAKTAAVQNGYVDAQNDFSQFKNEAGNIWNTLAAGLIRQLTGLGDTVQTALEGAENAGEGEKTRERARINRDLNAKKNELEEAREALKNLDDDASESLRGVLKNRVERLKAEVDDLEIGPGGHGLMFINRENAFLQTIIRCTTRMICLGALAWFGLIVADTAGSINGLLRTDDPVAIETTNATEIPDD